MQPGDIFDAEDYRNMEEGYFGSVMNQLDELAAQDKPFFLQYWPMFPLTFTRSDIEQGRTLNGGPMAEGVVTVDEWVGKIMDKIDSLGIADNTIVVVMGDNGPFMEFVDKSGQSDRIYRGGKGLHLEGGVRVNAYARWPGVFEAGTRAQDIFHVADLYTTFARLANADQHIPRDRLIDGIDQTPTLLMGEGYGRRDYVFIYEGPVLKSVVKQQFKFHVPPPGANPILEGATYDLYKNPREDRPQDSIALAVGFGANFGMMIKRHQAMKIKYPNRQPAHGDAYGGIENLRPETLKLLEKSQAISEYYCRRTIATRLLEADQLRDAFNTCRRGKSKESATWCSKLIASDYRDGRDHRTLGAEQAGATNRLPIGSRKQHDNHNPSLEFETALPVTCDRPSSICEQIGSVFVLFQVVR